MELHERLLSQILVESKRQHEPKPIAEMLGEVLRDIGLLIVTFLPVDAVFSGTPVQTPILVAGIFWGLFFITLGLLLEKIK